ncbi:hypothetical protein Tco_0128655 [Tanacetum coccineum]
MNKIKSANRNTANYHLYHALMEALIADEDAMDKEVADKVKDHKRKHDSDDDEDDEDDEGPSAGSNQGRSTKRRRSDFALLVSSTSSETMMAKPIPESERPATPEPEWTIPPNDFPEPENNWANTYATTYKVPEENKLQRKTYDIGSFIKWFCRRTGKKKLCKADLEGGPPGQVTIQPQFFFNKDLDYLLTGDKERKIALSISKLKAARYLDFGLEELVPSLWVESEREYDINAVYGITHWWFRRKEFYINKHSEPSDREAFRSRNKISEKDFKNLHPNDFEDLFLLNIQEKLNHLPKTDKTSLHTAVNMWIRSLVIRNRVGDLQLGIEKDILKMEMEMEIRSASDIK